MMWSFPLFPEAASSVAGKVDALYFALVAVLAFFTLLVYGLVLVFAVKYRRGRNVDRSNPPASSHKLEALWIGVPLVIAMGLFIWSASVYFTIKRAPAGAMEIYVVAKQWMWKIQSPHGAREINELHVPVGVPVKLIMTSQDVIHSFFVPAFRLKQDVLPGRYTTLWFEPTKVGTYHLFCAEYCGTEHSGMIGRIVVMEKADYQAWLAGGVAGETPAASGARMVTQLGCTSCHVPGGGGRAPNFQGLFGTTVPLQGGGTAVFDEAYVRESILTPRAKVVQGYDPIMPTYAGQITEEQILQVIAYLKSIGSGAGSPGSAGGATSAGGAAGTPGATTGSDAQRQTGSGIGSGQSNVGGAAATQGSNETKRK